jgi:predicted esterase
MKKLLSILLVAACLLSQGQTVIKKMFTVDANGAQLAGMLTTPKDYATNPDSCALIIFFHGTGEAGDGTLATVTNIYNNGSPVGLAAGGNAMTFTSPVTGKAIRFITIGLQGVKGWCAYSAQGDYVLRNDVLKNYRISRNMVFITGLSAGAEVTWEAITSATAGIYAAAIPMSTPAPAVGAISNITSNGIKIWAFHGQQDAGPTDYYNSVRLVNQVNADKAGQARLTTLPGGHCCWAANYDPNYRENITYVLNGARYTKALDVYEFCLLCAKGNNTSFDTTAVINGPIVTPPAPVTPVAAITKAAAAVTAAGNTITMDGSLSTGTGGINSSGWYISDSKGNYMKPAAVISGGMDLGKGSPGKTVISLPNGAYNVRLTIQDIYGGTDKTTVAIVVGAAPAGPAVVQTFTAAGVTYTLYSDNTWK